MKNLDRFTQQYSISKTLRFELKPIGKTLEYIDKNGILINDEKRAENYIKIKKIIDEYHKDFIEQCLSGVKLKLADEGKKDSLEEYFFYYSQRTKTPQQNKSFDEIKMALRRQIASSFTANSLFSRINKKELIKEDLPRFVESSKYTNILSQQDEFSNVSKDTINLQQSNDKELVAEFNDFTTYFTGFHENRQNMYVADKKSTAISFRLIDQNLPKFIDNIATFEYIRNTSVSNSFQELYNNIEEYLSTNTIDEMFTLAYFADVLSQKQIDVYNLVISGRTEKEGKPKIKGLNEYINSYNQQQKDKSKRIPKLKQLYKQILSDRNAISFLPDEFSNDNEALESIERCYQEINSLVLNRDSSKGTNLKQLLTTLGSFDTKKVYITNDLQLTNISQKLFGDWSVISKAIEKDFTSNNPQKKNEAAEAYDERIKKLIKNNGSFSISYINVCLHNTGKCETIEDYFATLGATNTATEQKENLFAQIENNYTQIQDLLNTPYPDDKNLMEDKNNVIKIKVFLDSIKDLQHFIKPLLGDRGESEKDEKFYGDFTLLWDEFDKITPLYNEVRNYMTRKPYNMNKIKLNFDRVQLVTNWPKFEQGFILKNTDNTKFYLAIPAKNETIKVIDEKPKQDSDSIELMIYEQGKAGQMVQNLILKNGKVTKVNGHKIGISKDDSKLQASFVYKDKTYIGKVVNNDSLDIIIDGKRYLCSIEKDFINLDLEMKKNSFLPSEINRIRKSQSYNKGENFNKNDLIKFIDFYKPLVETYKKKKFNYKKSEEYTNFKEFTDDIDSQAYSLIFSKISFSNIKQLVEDGKLYLFQIYNKDFSPYSKGTPNMHTLYWKMLFDKENLNNVVYKLNGQAEIFFRKNSIKPENRIVHPAKQPIENKNALNTKKQSTFMYDMIKDRRYTIDKFQFHVPITMNFKALGNNNINQHVFDYLKEGKDLHIIGIDRGERHLLYLSVIDLQGNIKEQYSLNEITNEYKDKDGNCQTAKTNYHNLLDVRGVGNTQARQDWLTIENVKELKEGYLSQVIHKICQLIVKYNAIVVLEDLNFGFKRSRQKVEKQVYQKFEKMLIDKLNYYVDKHIDPTQTGGLLNALQLTNKFESFQKIGKQSGILFYTPAWNTSKMDPKTGFVNFFNSRYESIEKAKLFFSKFSRISYNKEKNWFEFEVKNYTQFDSRAEGTRQNWTLCTFGNRIETFRNPEKNNKWDNKEINLTEAFKDHLKGAGIDINANLKEEITNQAEKPFFEGLLHLLKLTLQMRNSITNTEIDYLISPVMNANGEFYDSRKVVDKSLPENADANGAYNIARKGLWIIEQIKQVDDLKKLKLAISNKEWLQFAQKANN